MLGRLFLRELALGTSLESNVNRDGPTQIDSARAVSTSTLREADPQIGLT